MASKLFISFTGALLALEHGRVTESDLSVGLFVFGCARVHAFTPGAHGEYIEPVVTRRPDLHRILLDVLVQAEVDGRVRWRSENEPTTFSLVNELLTANGYDPLLPGEHQYSYPAVSERSWQIETVW